MVFLMQFASLMPVNYLCIVIIITVVERAIRGILRSCHPEHPEQIVRVSGHLLELELDTRR